jgi:hypothetical protein
VPPRLLGGGENAELIEFMHLLRFPDFIMQLCGVNRNGRAEKTATPRVQSALARQRDWRVGLAQAAGYRVRARLLHVQIIFD